MKITFLNILRLLSPLIFTNILVLGVFYFWFSNDLTILQDKMLVLVFVSILLLSTVPQLIVVINHYKMNKKVLLTIEADTLIITDKNGKNIKINDKNIVSWQLVGTAGKIRESSIKFSLL